MKKPLPAGSTGMNIIFLIRRFLPNLLRGWTGLLQISPFPFLTFKSFPTPVILVFGARVNLARHKLSLSTCSGCHNGDTGTMFQMVKPDRQGIKTKAFFASFMVGHGKEQPAVVDDQENPGEKHEFLI